jgi:hypothetical protein
MIGILGADGSIARVVASMAGEAAPHGTVADVPIGFLTGDLSWDGAAFVDAMAVIEARLLAAIDRQAAAAMADFVAAPEVLQEFRREKRRELAAWQAAGEPAAPEAGAYPFIEAEAAAKGVGFTTVAGQIATALAASMETAPAVEAARVAGRAAVRAATTKAAKEAAAATAEAAIAAAAEA